MPSRLTSLLCLLVVLVAALLVHHSTASSYTAYKPQTLDDSSKREAMSLLNRIADIVQYGNARTHFLKRNGGTADTLYNLPDLMDIGKRRFDIVSRIKNSFSKKSNKVTALKQIRQRKTKKK